MDINKSPRKVALVTGSAKNLGAAIIRMLALNMYDVVINYYTSEKEAKHLAGEVAQNGVTSLAIYGDVSKSDQCREIVEAVQKRFGKLDVLINNVGPWTSKTLHSLLEEEYDIIMEGNIKGTFLISKYAYPLLKTGGNGKIINISSCAAFVRDESIYGVAKNGIKCLTETMALEYAPHITVNAVAPGLIVGHEVSDESISAETESTLTKKLPKFDDVAKIIEIMLSPAFDFITGHTLTMDGGKSIPVSCKKTIEKENEYE